MEIMDLTTKAKRDFNNAICLMGIIPLLTFVYLLTRRIASWEIFVGRTGYIAFNVLIIFLAGIILGRKMLWSLILKLLDFNQQIIKIQEELIAKNKLIAITETALTLGHEINNPLLVIRGNLEMLDSVIINNAVPADIKERLSTIRTNFNRIGEVTEKLSLLAKPTLETVCGDTRIIDLIRSR